jgi:hypothetical protein
MTIEEERRIYEMEQRIQTLEQHIEKVDRTLGTFICWTMTSANSPISGDEARKLLLMLIEKEPSATPQERD